MVALAEQAEVKKAFEDLMNEILGSPQPSGAARIYASGALGALRHLNDEIALKQILETTKAYLKEIELERASQT